MCFSKPPKVQPIRQAPSTPPEIVDDVAARERDELRRQRRRAYGRQSTILAGKDGGGTPPTLPAKTALGS